MRLVQGGKSRENADSLWDAREHDAIASKHDEAASLDMPRELVGELARRIGLWATLRLVLAAWWAGLRRKR